MQKNENYGKGILQKWEEEIRVWKQWEDSMKKIIPIEISVGLILQIYYTKFVADACEYGNEPLGSMKCGEFLD